MLFYFTLFLAFLYFKIARVHKKEEKLSSFMYAQHIFIAIAVMALFTYGLQHYTFVNVLLSSFVFFIVAALLVTTVQLGIFIDGKPLLGISKLYKIMPLLALCIALFSFGLWGN